MSVLQASAVAITGDGARRALLLIGPSGSGKSSLTLALIDRGAVLIGDDGVRLSRVETQVHAAAPPGTTGLLEVRGLGLLSFPVAAAAPVGLVIQLIREAPRFVERAGTTTLLGTAIPCIALTAHEPLLALKAELALVHYGAG